MLAKNFYGSRALHLACKSEMVRAIFNHMNSGNLLSLLESEDSKGNTPVLSLTQLGKDDALKELLEHIENNCHSEMPSWLQKYNNCNRNILHLAALSQSFEKLYDVLVECLHSVDTTQMMYPDVSGNTPIHYVADRCSTRVFADFMLRLPLPMKQHVMKYANDEETTCLDIITRPFSGAHLFANGIGRIDVKKLPEISTFFESNFLKMLIKHAVGSFSYVYYNEDILKVMQHALNYYSLPSHISLSALPALETESENWLHKEGEVSLFLAVLLQLYI